MTPLLVVFLGVLAFCGRYAVRMTFSLGQQLPCLVPAIALVAAGEFFPRELPPDNPFSLTSALMNDHVRVFLIVLGAIGIVASTAAARMRAGEED
jgi:hypothetical protein